jgi:hypothetical protein
VCSRDWATGQVRGDSKVKLIARSTSRLISLSDVLSHEAYLSVLLAQATLCSVVYTDSFGFLISTYGLHVRINRSHSVRLPYDMNHCTYLKPRRLSRNRPLNRYI